MESPEKNLWEKQIVIVKPKRENVEPSFVLGRLLQKAVAEALLTFTHMIKMDYSGVYREMGLNPSVLYVLLMLLSH